MKESSQKAGVSQSPTRESPPYYSYSLTERRDSAAKLILKGDAAYALGRTDRAEELYRQALRLQPSLAKKAGLEYNWETPFPVGATDIDDLERYIMNRATQSKEERDSAPAAGDE